MGNIKSLMGIGEQNMMVCVNFVNMFNGSVQNSPTIYYIEIKMGSINLEVK